MKFITQKQIRTRLKLFGALALLAIAPSAKAQVSAYSFAQSTGAYTDLTTGTVLGTATANTSSIVSKVWAFCNTLRDDGVGYGDYLEQLTYLLFLKMADEYTKPPYNRQLPIPAIYKWESLADLKGAELEAHYTILLRELGK